MARSRADYRFVWLRRALLWLALGPRTYRYMRNTLAIDPRVRGARMVDVVVRKDSVERRYEADWCKNLCRIVVPEELARCEDCRVPVTEGHGRGRDGGPCKLAPAGWGR